MVWLASRWWFTILILLSLAQPLSALIGRTPTPMAVQTTRSQRRRQTLAPLALNRIFCEPEELQPPLYHPNEQQLPPQVQQQEQSRMVHFPKADHRFEHIRDILKLKPGDNLKIGVIDVGCTDAAGIHSTTKELTITFLPLTIPNDNQRTEPDHSLPLKPSPYPSPSQRLFP